MALMPALPPPAAGAGSLAGGGVTGNPVLQTFTNPVVQLGALSPIAALAALNPTAALAALSPALNIVNPAVNPAATLLLFNLAAAPALALARPFALVPGAFGAPGFGGI